MKVSRSTRSILITALGVGLICSVPTVSMARVKGVCANCHTMHASQQNDGRKAFTGTTTTPRTGLLANDCYGCHTDSSASFNLFSSIGAPLVVVTQGPNATDTLLPGGFIEINATEETQHSISAVTGTGLSSPPGWNAGDSSATNSHRDGITWTNTTLVCAGTYGCHGDPQEAGQGAAVSGIHHRATALGYRGLYGISGIESTNYNVELNIYSGVSTPTNTKNFTISSLCAQCHSDFHDLGDDKDTTTNGGTDTAWIRHPTDFALSLANQTNDDYTGYSNNAEVPIGKVWSSFNVTVNSGQSWPVANRVVICLSCHRAHGSRNNDLLRWSYETMVASTTGAGAGKGCFRCHTTKDGI